MCGIVGMVRLDGGVVAAEEERGGLGRKSPFPKLIAHDHGEQTWHWGSG